jgi:hypothetical protein
MAQSDNPIRSVGGVAVPAPSKYDWKESDVSSADAGRTEDALMHKEMIAKKIHIELEWANMNDADVQTVLQAFSNNEYFSVTYYDYKAMAFLTKTFYVGDRSVSAYNRAMKISTISFNIIEQ